jgi:hypothetical protein
MNEQNQQDQWAEHLRDEAGAIARQQVTAGHTHSPLEGPLPHTKTDMAVAAEDAVLLERERCAAIVASFAAEERLAAILPGATPDQLRAAASAAWHIAGLLRES